MTNGDVEPPAMSPDIAQLRTTRSRLRPIHWWSAVSAALVLVQVYALVAWSISSDAPRQLAGADPAPDHVKIWARILQAPSLTAIVSVYIWRRSRRGGNSTWDMLVAIVFAGGYWQNTIINYFRPNFFSNSYLIDFNAWNPHILGWLSPYMAAPQRRTHRPSVLTNADRIHGTPIHFRVSVRICSNAPHPRWSPARQAQPARKPMLKRSDVIADSPSRPDRRE
jgi:hypothetical protein